MVRHSLLFAGDTEISLWVVPAKNLIKVSSCLELNLPCPQTALLYILSTVQLRLCVRMSHAGKAFAMPSWVLPRVRLGTHAKPWTPHQKSRWSYPLWRAWCCISSVSCILWYEDGCLRCSGEHLQGIVGAVRLCPRWPTPNLANPANQVPNRDFQEG